MRQLTVAMLTTCLLGTTAVVASAQEPSPSASSGSRVEMPLLGFALTFPREYETDDWGFPTSRVATMRDGPGVYKPRCGVVEYLGPEGTWATVADMREWFVTYVDGLDGFVVSDSADVELSAGRAARVTVVNDYDPYPSVVWLVTDGDSPGTLWCSAEVPPDDDWLSIAETIEFLPVEE